MFLKTTTENVEFVGMVMLYPHTKFHMPNSYGSLVKTIKVETKQRL